MKNTMVYDLINNPKIPNRAYGYRYKNSTALLDLMYLDGCVGDGAVYSSVEDLLKWDAALRTEKLVKASTLNMIFTPYTLTDGKSSDYGFGWFIKDTKSGKTLYHTGINMGFRTKFIRNLSNNYSMMLLSNVPDMTLFDAMGELED